MITTIALPFNVTNKTNKQKIYQSTHSIQCAYGSACNFILMFWVFFFLFFSISSSMFLWFFAFVFRLHSSHQNKKKKERKKLWWKRKRSQTPLILTSTCFNFVLVPLSSTSASAVSMNVWLHSRQWKIINIYKKKRRENCRSTKLFGNMSTIQAISLFRQFSLFRSFSFTRCCCFN